MSWTESKHSKSQVRKAGDYLIRSNKNIDYEKYFHSLQILSNWRSSHAYPMQSMLRNIKRKSQSVDNNALVVQRLKRNISILTKLYDLKGLRLDRMEDIAGIRVVVKDMESAYKVRDSIIGSRTQNTLKRERDYIAFPKDSGYRCIL